MIYKTYGIRPPKLQIFHDNKMNIVDGELIVYEFETIRKKWLNHHNFVKAYDFQDNEIKISIEEQNEIIFNNNEFTYVKERLNEEKEILLDERYNDFLFAKMLIFDNKYIAKYVKYLQLKKIEETIKNNLYKIDVEMEKCGEIEDEILPYII